MRTIALRATKIHAAMAQAKATFDDWQAELLEILLLPPIYERWLEANHARYPQLEVVRLAGRPHKSFTSEMNREVGSRQGWREFAGYSMRYGEHLGWNFAAADWYGHAPSVCWDGIRRETIHYFILDIRSIVYAIQEGRTASLHYSVWDTLTQQKIKILDQPPVTPQQLALF